MNFAGKIPRFLTTNTLPHAKHALILGKGVIVTDEGGKKYIDLCSSTLNMALGHRHADVMQAVNEQLNKVWFVPTYFQNPAFFELGELLVKYAPDEITAVNMRLCDGADAVETACKMALLHTRRKKLLCIQTAWHGETLGTLPLSSLHAYHRINLQAEIHYSDEPTLASVADLIEANPDAAAVLLDPVGVSNGVFSPKNLHTNLQHIRSLCSKFGILLIFDEVQTFGGYMGDTLFASTHFGVTPDVICIGKALGSGLPLGATLCRDELRAVISKREGEFTFGGQPLACTAAIQGIKSFLSMTNQVSKNLAALEEAVIKVIDKFSMLCFRQVGFFVAITRKDEKYQLGWVARVYELSLEAGLLVWNNHGSSILLKPPIVIEPKIIWESLEKFACVLSAAESDLEAPPQLYTDLIKANAKLTTLTRIKKKPPVHSQWEYVGALLSHIGPTLSVRKVDAEEQALISKRLRRFGVPAVNIFTSAEGYPEYTYQPGVSMDFFMHDYSCTDPGMVNGLVLEHQRYVEMAHDAGLSIPDRWPGNAIVTGTSLSLIDFDLTYSDSTGSTTLLFTFEEVFSTFQCVAWVKNPTLQQDLANRLCLAVVQRQGPLAQTVWGNMSTFYSNPSKPYLPESLSHIDYMKAIETITKGFHNLS